jgi:hypothetical protein
MTRASSLLRAWSGYHFSLADRDDGFQTSEAKQADQEWKPKFGTAEANQPARTYTQGRKAFKPAAECEQLAEGNRNLRVQSMLRDMARFRTDRSGEGRECR